jgi:hypothetical protein
MSTRMIPFIYSSTIAYSCEFGEYYIAFFYDGELLNGDGAPIETPYLEDDLPQLQIEQVGDTMWITHPDYKQRKLTRTTVITFSLDIVTFEKGPFLVRNDIANDDGVTMAYAGTLTNGSVGTLTCSVSHFQSGHVGALYQLTHKRIAGDAKVSSTGAGDSDYLDIKGNFSFNTHGTWTGTVYLKRTEGDNEEEIFRTFIANGDRNIQYTGTETQYNTKYRFTAVAGMSDAFGADITANSSVTEGIVRIDSITSSTVAVCTVLALIGAETTDTTLRWAEGAWSDVQGYPRSVTFFNDRCVYAGQRYGWLSRTSDYENFDDDVKADDAFSVILPTGNEIMWVDTVDKTIVFGTTGPAWSLQSNKVGTVMTPTNFTLDEQSGFGSADIQGVKVNNAIIFIDYVQKKLMEYGFNAELQKYVSNEISILAEHMTATSTITWLAHQSNPESIIWFGMTDGTLHSFTYQRNQNVLAYAPHPTTGNVKSGCVVPSTGEDEIWLSVERDIGGGTDVSCTERMWPRRLTDEDDAHFVDSGVIYDGVPATTIPGGDHLEGDTVAILADGEVVTPQVVTNGSITLSTAASKVHYGLPFTPYLKPMRLDTETRFGSSHGSIKQIPELVLSLLDSKNVRVGDLTTNLHDVDLTSAELVNNGEIDGLFTGDVTVYHDGGFSVEDSILISSGETSDVTDPTPLTVRAIVARVDITGR